MSNWLLSVACAFLSGMSLAYYDATRDRVSLGVGVLGAIAGLSAIIASALS